MQDTGYTALMLACKGGHLDTVITLMEHSANIALRNGVRILLFFSKLYEVMPQ